MTKLIKGGPYSSAVKLSEYSAPKGPKKPVKPQDQDGGLSTKLPKK
jgi:hypothetical protein